MKINNVFGRLVNVVLGPDYRARDYEIDIFSLIIISLLHLPLEVSP